MPRRRQCMCSFAVHMLLLCAVLARSQVWLSLSVWESKCAYVQCAAHALFVCCELNSSPTTGMLLSLLVCAGKCAYVHNWLLYMPHLCAVGSPRTHRGCACLSLCVCAGNVANFVETEQILSIDEAEGPLAGVICHLGND